MLKKIHINLPFVLLFALLVAFAFSVVTSNASKVEAGSGSDAAIAWGQGTSCVEKRADCSASGMVNLADHISSMRFYGITSGAFANAVTEGWKIPGTDDPAPLSMICVREDFTNVTHFTFPVGHTGLNIPNVHLRSSGNATFHYIARGCYNGDLPAKQDGSFNNGVGGYEFWGCCPTGSTFVRDKNAGYGQFLGGCCQKSRQDSRPGDPDHPDYVDGGACYYNTDKPTNLAIRPAYSVGNFAGFDLGPDTAGIDTVMKAEAPVGAVMDCGSNRDGCAVVERTTGWSLPTDVFDPDIFDTAGDLQCQRCFAKGEYIRVVTPPGGSGTEPEMEICDGDGNTHYQPLINNSINDTLAWLRSQDQENRDFIADCRAKGGVPTAIGCVDTTPLGIITGLIRIGFGVMGGVALLQLILAGIAYQSGEDAKIKSAREKVIATLTGIAILVFSVLILRIIGINVLDVLPSGTV